jgi:hypothetical protein
MERPGLEYWSDADTSSPYPILHHSRLPGNIFDFPLVLLYMRLLESAPLLPTHKKLCQIILKLTTARTGSTVGDF